MSFDIGSLFGSLSSFTSIANLGGSLFSSIQGKQATSGYNGLPITNPTNLISKLKEGIAKPNKYLVEFRLPRGFDAPSVLPGVNSESASTRIRGVESTLNPHNTIGIMCHSCDMPARAIKTYTHKQLVSDYSVPNGVELYSPVTFSLYADSRFNTRHYFDVWQTTVLNIGSNTLNYYNEYTSDINIYMLNDAGEYSPYFVTLYEAWPTNIGEVALAYSSNNAFQTVNVTFAYKYWQSAFDDTKRGST